MSFSGACPAQLVAGQDDERSVHPSAKPEEHRAAGNTSYGVSGLMIYFASYFIVCTTLNAAETLHGKMTAAVVHAPVLFFDTNPAGRILNRFSKDTGNMDKILPLNIMWTIHMALFASIAFLLPAGANPWLMFVSCFVVALVAYIGWFYLKSSRELKRLEALRCSPVYSHINETALGLEVIRASGMTRHFLDHFHRFVSFEFRWRSNNLEHPAAGIIAGANVFNCTMHIGRVYIATIPCGAQNEIV